jgi:hypothetical protein
MDPRDEPEDDNGRAAGNRLEKLLFARGSAGAAASSIVLF